MQLPYIIFEQSHYQICEAWILVFSFKVLFLFSFHIFILGSRVRVRVTLQLHCHKSVTLDNTVTVIVTQSCGYIEHSRRFENNDVIQYI